MSDIVDEIVEEIEMKALEVLGAEKAYEAAYAHPKKSSRMFELVKELECRVEQRRAELWLLLNDCADGSE